LKTTVFQHPIWRIAGLPIERLAGLSGDFLDVEISELVARIAFDQSRSLLQAAFDEVLKQIPESKERTTLYNHRKAFFQHGKLPNSEPDIWHTEPRYEALRTAITTFKDAKSNHTAAESAYRAAWEAARLAGYETLRHIAQDDNFQRALLFSSHDLLMALPAWIKTPPGEWRKSHRSTLRSILKYATRMATRTTPLSRFATVGERAQPELDANQLWAAWSTHDAPTGRANRPDMTQLLDVEISQNQDKTTESQHFNVKITPNVAILEALYDVLLTRPVVRRAMSLRLNPSIVQPRSDDDFRWWYFNGQEEAIQRMPPNPLVLFVHKTMTDAPQQRRTYASICQQISEVTDDPDGAAEWLDSLIDFGFLEWIWPENGLSSGWAGRLYQWLGFLPDGSLDEAVTDAAFLLQWLRTAARTLPHQPVQEARATQQAALEQVRAFTSRWNGPSIPITAERVFYEDVSKPVTTTLDEAALHGLAHEIVEAWLQVPPQPEEDRSAILREVFEGLGNPEEIDFMTLLDRWGKQSSATNERKSVKIQQPAVPMTLLLQPWYDSATGQWHAVLNNMAGGGGRLYSRWYHLWSNDLLTDLRTWQRQAPQTAAFAWQGWFNANMQPVYPNLGIALPGDRVQDPSAVPLHLVRWRTHAEGHIEMWLPDATTPTYYVDMGLEASETRPRGIYLALFPALARIHARLLHQNNPIELEQHVLHDPGLVRHRIVFRRATWQIESAFWEDWKGLTGFDFYYSLRKFWGLVNMPRHMQYKFRQDDPPVWIDIESPLLVERLEYDLNARDKKAKWAVTFEEMLPAPDCMPDGNATEVAMEVKWGGGT
jgi:Lantibiotic dehydratase, N terminus